MQHQPQFYNYEQEQHKNLGGGASQVTQNPIYYGPYGTGASPQGAATAGDLGSANKVAASQSYPIAQRTAQMTSAGASSPIYGQASSLYGNEVAGNYLNGNPALTNQLASNQAASNRSAGDQSAQIRGADQRSGMQFSTANQQAQQGAQASANANAMNTNANAIASNYANERQIQNQAPELLNQSQTAQANLNQAGVNAYQQPIATAANINSGLFSGGQVAVPNTSLIQNPSALDYASQIIGMI